MQEDIAGIGQHQGRHGKYATFNAGRKMSEDFRGTPLVRTPVSRNAIGVLHYIFASWKNIVASVNDGHARSSKKIQSQAVQKDAKQSAFPKKKARSYGFCYEPRMGQ